MSRNTTARSLGWVLLAGLLTLMGCSSEKDPTAAGRGDTLDPSQQTVDLDDPYGGLLAANEDPAFGDDELAAAELDDHLVADGFAGLDPDGRAQAEEIENHRRVWYSLTVLWGNLEGPDPNGALGSHAEPSAPVVWDGSMWVKSGAFRVLRLISFEDPEDHLSKQRRDPATVAWVSVTHGDFDGLHVLLSYATGWDNTQQEAPDDTLHFRAGPCGDVVFPLAQLENLSTIIDIPDSQEKVSFTALRVEPAAQARGFCSGTWGWAAGDSVGRFGGRWLSYAGEARGYMRGHYGENSLGERVFFGKYIDHEGRFQGFLRGTYQVLRQVGNPNDPAGGPVNFEVGQFSGRWEDKEGDVLGDLHGSWSRVGRRPGVFSGSWRGMGIAP